MTFLLTAFGFLKNNSMLLGILAIGFAGLIVFYKVSSYMHEKEEITQERDRLVVSLKETKDALVRTADIANSNAKELEKEKLLNMKQVEDLKIKHEEDLKQKQTYTIIREKIKYEKDTSFISPVLRDTIIGLYGNKTTRAGN